jgi:hypothetical protein
MKATRVFQLTALALVVVSAVQVGYWLYDQGTYAIEKATDELALYSRQVEAAQSMLDAGPRKTDPAWDRDPRLQGGLVAEREPDADE